MASGFLPNSNWRYLKATWLGWGGFGYLVTCQTKYGTSQVKAPELKA